MSQEVIKIVDLTTVLDQRLIHNGVNLSVEKGKTTVILGRSGSGKSVLLKAIIRVLPGSSSGKIFINNEDILIATEERVIDIRKSLGFVFQSNALFDSMTVYENVGFLPLYYRIASQREIKDKVNELLDLVGLHNTGHLYPSQLSGGMKKRVGIARALIMEPALVLFDEPTSGLDPIMTDVFNEILNDLKKVKNLTSLLVTHDIHSVAKISDYVYLIEQGSVITSGTMDELHSSTDERVQQFIEGRSKGPIKV